MVLEKPYSRHSSRKIVIHSIRTTRPPRTSRIMLSGIALYMNCLSRQRSVMASTAKLQKRNRGMIVEGSWDITAKKSAARGRENEAIFSMQHAMKRMK